MQVPTVEVSEYFNEKVIYSKFIDILKFSDFLCTKPRSLSGLPTKEMSTCIMYYFYRNVCCCRGSSVSSGSDHYPQEPYPGEVRKQTPEKFQPEDYGLDDDRYIVLLLLYTRVLLLQTVKHYNFIHHFLTDSPSKNQAA